MRWLDGRFIRDLPSLTVKAPGVARMWHGPRSRARVITPLDSMAVMPFR
jgi:hypothetical protein